ncbi:MAG: ATP-grasp domain-containing protein [Candidatus Omnitrophica bacterium]|nr:ATP-grasp domain-containing protein [Candidatus Omnitrophota bacterium]
MTNSKPKILIVGAPNERHSHYMAQRIAQKGGSPLILDTLNFPAKVKLSLRNEKIFYQGEPLDEIAGCYLRTVVFFLPPYDLEDKRNAEGKLETDNWYRDYRAERERQSHLGSLLRVLFFRNIPVVNPVSAFTLHYLKPLQLEMLRREGIRVPETLVTNDPKKLLEFKQEVGKVIFKPVAGGAECRELTEEHLKPEKLERLQNAPVLFQELIPGENVRVYILESRILVAVIIKSETLDYRGHEQGFQIINLPPEVAQICIKAMRICGLKFTGMDLRLTPGGEFVVIECNPSAMFMGIEEILKVDISGALADFLMGRS